MKLNDKRIVFMGTADFSAYILNGLISNGYNVVGVVCQPDKPLGRHKILTPCLVKQIALSNDIEVFDPISIRKDFNKVLASKPDLIITSAYGQIIPKEVLDCPTYGCINTHASLLPKYRGASPIQTAIYNGEKVTGMSLMYMNEKMDEGDIIFQKELAIDIEDTSSTLFVKMATLALDMLLMYLPKIFNNEIIASKQDSSLATYTKMLDKEIEHINFNDNILTVYNHIRSLLDNPGCYFIHNNQKYKIIKVGFAYDNDTNPNTFIGLFEDYLRIDCIGGYLKIYEIKKEAKNSMKAKDFYNGNGRNLVNEKLG